MLTWPKTEIPFQELKESGPHQILIMDGGMILAQIVLAGRPSFTPSPGASSPARDALIAISVYGGRIATVATSPRGVTLEIPIEEEATDDPT